jgi:hypothetical protein
MYAPPPVASTEIRLAVLVEDFLDGLAGRLFDRLIGVNERQAEMHPEAPPD